MNLIVVAQSAPQMPWLVSVPKEAKYQENVNDSGPQSPQCAEALSLTLVKQGEYLSLLLLVTLPHGGTS